MEGSFEQIVGDQRTNKAYLDEIKKLSKEAGFFGFEVPIKIQLSTTVFSIDNDLLTPTFKLKRNEAKKYFFS